MNEEKKYIFTEADYALLRHLYPTNPCLKCNFLKISSYNICEMEDILMDNIKASYYIYQDKPSCEKYKNYKNKMKSYNTDTYVEGLNLNEYYKCQLEINELYSKANLIISKLPKELLDEYHNIRSEVFSDYLLKIRKENKDELETIKLIREYHTILMKIQHCTEKAITYMSLISTEVIENVVNKK